ncbi:hypothetical protein B0H17DRAFT_1194661 [Mycena rosella]|uniref:Uncharacterized protein n=1 Tax=Mycena rosella TaxID=1033263 RepID=A0AAD7GNG2_MYCRO|nr:hypothetical protein B0H17DRAFT_1194661 [Mycena rosella]
MTRSELSVHSPRVVRKAFRADAKDAGLTYRAAIAATKAKDAEEGKKVERPVGIIRRNPGRMDGVQWNGDSFVCARQVDGDVARPHDAMTWDSEDMENAPTSEQERPRGMRSDEACVAKKYEVLPAVRRVIELDDDTVSEQWETGSEAWEVQSEQWETQSDQWEIPTRDYTPEEWEELYGDKFGGEVASYSGAVCGNRP